MDSLREIERIRNLNEIILDNIDEWIRVVDRNYTVVFVNKAMQEAFGDVKGTKCYEFWGGMIPCQECISKIVRQDRSSQQREVEKQGQFFRVQCYPLMLDDGTCEESIEIITDVTNQKVLEAQREAYEKKLQEEVERKTTQIRKNQEIILRTRKNFENILNSMQDGVFVIDENCRIQYMNDIIIKTFGNKSNQKCYELIHGKDSPCDWCQSQRVFEEMKTVRLTYYSNNNSRYYDIIESPMIEPDGKIVALVIMRDITEMKRMDEEIKDYSHSLEERVKHLVEQVKSKERLALLGEISAGLAHELRNPMGSIIAGIKLMEGKEKSEEERQTIYEILKKESDRLNRALSEFLDYARPKKLQVHTIDINHLVGDIIKLCQQDLELLNDHTIKTDFASALPNISVDSDRIRQVFWNILANGLKSMKEKGTLSIKTSVHDHWLQVDIADTGKGIAPENIQKVFIPFFSLNKEGTGLGLSIAQRIMEEHKGKIEVESKEGKGSCFTIKFPLSDQIKA